MESLKIKTGAIALQIEDDFGNVRGTFRFNPEDVRAAQAVLDLQKDLQIKEKEYELKANKVESADDAVVFLNELVDYFENAIDTCFGEGTSELLFGEAKTISMFDDFFAGITPYYKKASQERLAKYQPKKKSGK